MRNRFLMLLVGILMSLTTLRGADAAPQVLAVLASETGVPFICIDGTCKAELTAFCLQEHRDPPLPGAKYRPAEAHSFTLAITTATGERIGIPATDIVDFVATRGFTSALAVLPESVVRGMKGVSASIVIDKYASLLPVPEPGDDNPLTREEVAAASGMLRRVGANVVDRNPNAVAAQFLARLSDRLMVERNYSLADYAKLFRHASERLVDRPLNSKSLIRARDAYNECIAYTGKLGFAAMSVCLAGKHDKILRDLNYDYWNSLAGS